MIAVTFPGQGSQRPGMGQDLIAHSDAAAATFDAVSSAIDLDMRTICFSLSEEDLRKTQNAQIALFTCSLAAWNALSELVGIKPSFFAGHSVGEYAAIVAAGGLDIADAARLVMLRGELMATSGTERPGTMAAVLGMDSKDLERVCQDSSGVKEVVIANDNCPGQLVISGDTDAVQRASALASERGAKRVLPLNVSGAFHSPLMDKPAQAMGNALKAVSFADTSVPVISNVTAQPVSSAKEFGPLLEAQLKRSVRWTESVQTMISLGTDTFIECGSGEVLTGLLKRIDRDVTGFAVVDGATLENASSSLRVGGKV
ncbi:MAG: ACP S-malonyltransferase [Armatimonadetes bacterium]|nr:ACP S-malonyltransferase [Armatimonadota bacterium]